MTRTQKYQRRWDLGLAIMQLTLPPGKKVDQGEIAAFCGVTRQMVSHMERQAIRKLQAAARKRGLLELLDIEEPPAVPVPFGRSGA